MSEPKMIDGETLNHEILKTIREARTKIITDGKSAIDNNITTDLRQIDENTSILASDEDAYNCLNQLENLFFKYGTEDDSEKDLCNLDEIYEIPGVKIKENGVEKNVSIFVKKDKIKALVRQAQDYERILGPSIGLKFPNQVYQFNYETTPILGAGYTAPRPKLASETFDEYEEYLKTFYHAQSIEPEKDDENVFRKPYPHELVDFKGSAPEARPDAQSEYYLIRHAELQNRHDNTQPLQPGDEHVVTDSEDVDFDNSVKTTPKLIFGSIKSALKRDENRQKIKYGLITTGAAAIGIITAVGTGFIPAALPSVAVIGFYIWAMGRINRDRRKAERNQEPRHRGGAGGQGGAGGTDGGQGGNQGNGGNRNPTGGGTDTPTDTPDIPDGQDISIADGSNTILTSLIQSQQHLKGIENRIALLENDIANLDPAIPADAEKIAAANTELADLKEQQRQMLEVLKGDVTSLMELFQIGKENGGPSL